MKSYLFRAGGLPLACGWVAVVAAQPEPLMPAAVPVVPPLAQQAPAASTTRAQAVLDRLRAVIQALPECPPEPDAVPLSRLAVQAVATAEAARDVAWRYVGVVPEGSAFKLRHEGAVVDVTVTGCELLKGTQSQLPWIGRDFDQRQLWHLTAHYATVNVKDARHGAETEQDLLKEAELTAVIDPCDGALVATILARQGHAARVLALQRGRIQQYRLWANDAEAWHALAAPPRVPLRQAIAAALTPFARSGLQATAVVAYCVEASTNLGQVTMANGDGPRQPIWYIEIHGQGVTGPLPSGAPQETTETMIVRVNADTGAYLGARTEFWVPSRRAEPTRTSPSR